MHINAKKTIKCTILAIIGTVVLFVGVVCYLYVPNPIKITNPYHQWFNPDNFRFEDYMNRCIAKETLAKLFPIGTDKVFVDRVLVKAGGARIYKSKILQNKYNYFYKPRHWANIFFPHTFNIRVEYDDKNHITSMLIGGDSLHPDVYSYYQECKSTKN